MNLGLDLGLGLGLAFRGLQEVAVHHFVHTYLGCWRQGHQWGRLRGVVDLFVYLGHGWGALLDDALQTNTLYIRNESIFSHVLLIYYFF